ncbi:hypothetical protein NE664_07755 [Anaerotignum faecicola]|nr:hypothetical protein [Anaerotignum faecicola]
MRCRHNGICPIPMYEAGNRLLSAVFKNMDFAVFLETGPGAGGFAFAKKHFRIMKPYLQFTRAYTVEDIISGTIAASKAFDVALATPSCFFLALKPLMMFSTL